MLKEDIKVINSNKEYGIYFKNGIDPNDLIKIIQSLIQQDCHFQEPEKR